MIRLFLSWLGFPKCPRCGGLFIRKRGSMIVAFGPNEEGGEFIESEPTCCLPDQVGKWLRDEPWWVA